MKQNDFYADLEYSQGQATNERWERAYKKVFKNISSINCVKQDGWAQRAGIDRLIVLDSGRTITIDEKTRRKNYGDILLEFLSNKEQGKQGWVEKDLKCDYIAYAVEATDKFYLLPTLELQRAWLENKEQWLKEYGTKEAMNKYYTTVNCPVPIKTLYQALVSSTIIEW